MSESDLKTRLIAALKSGKIFHLRDCSVCNYPLSFFAEGDQLYFDPGCKCSSFGPEPPRPSDWTNLDFYCDPSHGHVENIEKFISSTP